MKAWHEHYILDPEIIDILRRKNRLLRRMLIGTLIALYVSCVIHIFAFIQLLGG